MCNYVKAKKGYRFVLTAEGKKNPRIWIKFDDDYIHRGQYNTSVPKRWLNAGYVEEVEDRKVN